MTRRLIAGMLALSMTATAFALPASAEAAAPAANAAAVTQTVGKIAKNDKFIYRLDTDGTVTILGLTKKAINSKGVVTIPAKLEGKTVVNIDRSTYDFFTKNWKKIKVVDVPACVNDIVGTGIGFKSVTRTDDYTKYRNQAVKIRCYSGSGAENYAVMYNVKYVLKDKNAPLAAPVIKDKAVVTRKFARFSWFPVKGASGYEILKSNNGGKTYKVIKTISGANNTTYKTATLKRDKGYTFAIRAFKNSGGEKEWGRNSNDISVMTNFPNIGLSELDIGDGFSLAFELHGDYDYNYSRRIDVFDEDSRKWCEASWGVETTLDNSVYYKIDGYYVIRPDNKKELYQGITPGQTYRVRVCLKGSIFTGAVTNECSGKYSRINLTAD